MSDKIESLFAERTYLIEKIRELNDAKRRIRIRQELACNDDVLHEATRDHGRANNAYQRASSRLTQVSREIKEANMRRVFEEKRRMAREMVQQEEAV